MGLTSGVAKAPGGAASRGRKSHNASSGGGVNTDKKKRGSNTTTTSKKPQSNSSNNRGGRKLKAKYPVGTRILRRFEGYYHRFEGKIVSFDGYHYRVDYDDGDSGDMSEYEFDESDVEVLPWDTDDAKDDDDDDEQPITSLTTKKKKAAAPTTTTTTNSKRPNATATSTTGRTPAAVVKDKSNNTKKKKIEEQDHQKEEEVTNKSIASDPTKKEESRGRSRSSSTSGQSSKISVSPRKLLKPTNRGRSSSPKRTASPPPAPASASASPPIPTGSKTEKEGATSPDESGPLKKRRFHGKKDNDHMEADESVASSSSRKQPPEDDTTNNEEQQPQPQQQRKSREQESGERSSEKMETTTSIVVGEAAVAAAAARSSEHNNNDDDDDDDRKLPAVVVHHQSSSNSSSSNSRRPASAEELEAKKKQRSINRQIRLLRELADHNTVPATKKAASRQERYENKKTASFADDLLLLQQESTKNQNNKNKDAAKKKKRKRDSVTAEEEGGGSKDDKKIVPTSAAASEASKKKKPPSDTTSTDDHDDTNMIGTTTPTITNKTKKKKKKKVSRLLHEVADHNSIPMKQKKANRLLLELADHNSKPTAAARKDKGDSGRKTITAALSSPPHPPGIAIATVAGPSSSSSTKEEEHAPSSKEKKKKKKEKTSTGETVVVKKTGKAKLKSTVERKAQKYPVGTLFFKVFGEERHAGLITGYDGEYYQVRYPKDGDEEELSDNDFNDSDIEFLPAAAAKGRKNSRLDQKTAQEGDTDEDNDEIYNRVITVSNRKPPKNKKKRKRARSIEQYSQSKSKSKTGKVVVGVSARGAEASSTNYASVGQSSKRSAPSKHKIIAEATKTTAQVSERLTESTHKKPGENACLDAEEEREIKEAAADLRFLNASRGKVEDDEDTSAATKPSVGNDLLCGQEGPIKKRLHRVSLQGTVTEASSSGGKEDDSRKQLDDASRKETSENGVSAPSNVVLGSGVQRQNELDRPTMVRAVTEVSTPHGYGVEVQGNVRADNYNIPCDGRGQSDLNLLHAVTERSTHRGVDKQEDGKKIIIDPNTNYVVIGCGQSISHDNKEPMVVSPIAGGRVAHPEKSIHLIDEYEVVCGDGDTMIEVPVSNRVLFGYQQHSNDHGLGHAMREVSIIPGPVQVQGDSAAQLFPFKIPDFNTPYKAPHAVRRTIKGALANDYIVKRNKHLDMQAVTGLALLSAAMCAGTQASNIGAKAEKPEDSPTQIDSNGKNDSQGKTEESCGSSKTIEAPLAKGGQSNVDRRASSELTSLNAAAAVPAMKGHSQDGADSSTCSMDDGNKKNDKGKEIDTGSDSSSCMDDGNKKNDKGKEIDTGSDSSSCMDDGNKKNDKGKDINPGSDSSSCVDDNDGVALGKEDGRKLGRIEGKELGRLDGVQDGAASFHVGAVDGYELGLLEGRKLGGLIGKKKNEKGKKIVPVSAAVGNKKNDKGKKIEPVSKKNDKGKKIKPVSEPVLPGRPRSKNGPAPRTLTEMRHAMQGKQRKNKAIKEALPTDILFGRGGMSNNHPGNQKYLAHLRIRALDYSHMPSRKMKTRFAMEIVQELKRKGMRFLHKEKDGYVEGTDDEARKKVSQRIREIALELKDGMDEVPRIPKSRFPKPEAEAEAEAAKKIKEVEETKPAEVLSGGGDQRIDQGTPNKKRKLSSQLQDHVVSERPSPSLALAAASHNMGAAGHNMRAPSWRANRVVNQGPSFPLPLPFAAQNAFLNNFPGLAMLGGTRFPPRVPAPRPVRFQALQGPGSFGYGGEREEDAIDTARLRLIMGREAPTQPVRGAEPARRRKKEDPPGDVAS